MPHTPKGDVYWDNERKRYFGADNAGHVGFGFKVWSGAENDLKYLGNAPHNNPDAIVERGTQRTQTKRQQREGQTRPPAGQADDVD